MKQPKFVAGIVLLMVTQLTAVTISPSPYGINVHLANDKTLAKVKAAGIAWIRIDVDWSAIEAERGKFNYTEVDRVVNYAAANGLSVYASIGSTPGWANKKKGINYPPTNVADWKDFVYRTVNRYRNKVKYWGIWNEPNLDIFFASGKDVFVQKILLPAAKTIRAADQAAFIVGPELSHKTETGTEWYFWMKYILDHAGNYFDVISHHIYEDLGVYYLYELLEKGDYLIPSVKQIVEEAGHGDKPFWLTETGWHTRKYSEAVQAERYLEMLHARARNNYPQKIFFYEIIDGPPNPNFPDAPLWGILHYNLDAKPAYNTYKDYIAGLLPDPDDPDEDADNKKCYAEQNAGNGAPAARNPELRETFRARDFLRGYSPNARKAVDVYYDWNREFHKIALADSRVFNLGREILKKATAFLAGNPGTTMAQPLPESLYKKARALLAILKNEYGKSPLAPVIRLADKHLSVNGRAPLHDLLEFYLQEDIRNFETR